ncbi:MAG TPA: homocysteine S-methyltransferase family protein [Bryobacteraceae bacterium]|nr:homocysteine S-methyltransferase family protein [Bryobacteraceae bacterium]
MDQARQQALVDALKHRILVLDGAMGTMIHAEPLELDRDFLGRENCPEILVATVPDVIRNIHRKYLEAGADIVETNSFGGTKVVLAEFDLVDRAHELNVAAARLAREAAAEFSTPGKPRFVAGSLGPTTKASITLTGGITFPELEENYFDQGKSLIEGGVDLLLIETAQDTRNIKAALLGVERAKRSLASMCP